MSTNHIFRNIQDNEKLEFKGPTIIEGVLGNNVDIRVENGGVSIRPPEGYIGLTVGNNVTIETSGIAKKGNDGRVNIGSIVIAGNTKLNNVVIGAQEVVVHRDNMSATFNKDSSGLEDSDFPFSGIEINGAIGDKVKLLTDEGNIYVGQGAGDDLVATANGDDSVLMVFPKVGRGSKLYGDQVLLGEVGEGANVESFGQTEVRHARGGRYQTEGTLLAEHLYDGTDVAGAAEVVATSIAQGVKIDPGIPIRIVSASAHSLGGYNPAT